MIGDLRHYGEVVGNVDRGRVLLADNLLERLQHLDLGGYVERRGRLVEHHQVGFAAQRHGRHQTLQLTAGDLVRIAITDAVRVRQFKRVVQLDRALVGFFLGQTTVQYGCFGNLLVDRDRRVEGSRRALREIGDVTAAQVALFQRWHAEHVLTEQAAFAAGEVQAGLGIGQRGQRDRGFTRARFTDQRDHFALVDVKGDTLDDLDLFAVVVGGADAQVFDFK